MYREFLPHTLLQPYVYCYWQLKTTAVLTEPFIYRVVADGCIDVFFDRNRPQDAAIMGFAGQHTAFGLGTAFHYTGIRFLPAMLPVLFPLSAADLSGRTFDLDAVWPSLAAFVQDRMPPLLTDNVVNRFLDECLLQHMARLKPASDHRLLEAVALILEQSGSARVEQIRTGASPRQLRRLFAHYIGDTPKTFSKIVRFQKLLQADPMLRSMRQDKRFFDSGYYDQAHFIREFRQLYGLTPGEVFRD